MSFKDLTLDTLQRQYGYTNFSHLLMNRAEVWDKHFGDITKKLNDEILNVETCISEALDFFWGRLYKITREFEGVGGKNLVLTDDEFRDVIRIKQFGTRWDGTIDAMNAFLKDLYGKRGNAYMIDQQDMSVEIFVFDFQLSETELFLFRFRDILPRPAAVGIKIVGQEREGKWFGFGTYDKDENPDFLGFGTYTDDKTGRFATYND